MKSFAPVTSNPIKIFKICIKKRQCYKYKSSQTKNRQKAKKI